MTTFNPPFEPSIPNQSVAVKSRALIAEFGEGYTQRGGDGLNPISKNYSLAWNGLSVADADEIVAFFEARKGYEAFEWTAPRDSTPKKWMVQEWNRQHVTDEIDAISATFIQVFDL